MNDIPRQVLREIIIKYGTSITDQPKRVEALLRDLCGEYKVEINVLVVAMWESIPNDLLSADRAYPSEVLLAKLTQRLRNNRALSMGAAAWAVASWAMALRITAQVNAVQQRPVSNLTTPTPIPPNSNKLRNGAPDSQILPIKPRSRDQTVSIKTRPTQQTSSTNKTPAPSKAPVSPTTLKPNATSQQQAVKKSTWQAEATRISVSILAVPVIIGFLVYLLVYILLSIPSIYLFSIVTGLPSYEVTRLPLFAPVNFIVAFLTIATVCYILAGNIKRDYWWPLRQWQGWENPTRVAVVFTVMTIAFIVVSYMSQR